MLFSEERVGIRTADRKYVRWDSGKEEVYDLRADPGESRDVGALEETIRPLRELYATVDHTVRTTPLASARGLHGGSRGPLRALGYVQ